MITPMQLETVCSQFQFAYNSQCLQTTWQIQSCRCRKTSNRSTSYSNVRTIISLVHSVTCCINHHLTHSSVSESIGENERLKAENTNLKAKLFFLLEARSDDCSPDIESGEKESGEDDEEDDKEDDVPQTCERQTLVSENILPNFALLSVKAAVEDSLFEKVNLNKDKVLDLLLSDPLNSYMLSMDRNAYPSIREHINAKLADTADKIEKSVHQDDHLTNIEIPRAGNDVLNWEAYIRRQKKEVEALKGRLEETKKSYAASTDLYKLLQDQKEALVADIKRMGKAKEVASVLKEVMEQLSDFHKNTGPALPLCNISSEVDPNLNVFKERCGLTDYASTKLSQRKLIAISRAASMLGLEYSPYFLSNRFPKFRTGKSSTKNQLREQICKVFMISNNGNAAAAFKSPKRKRDNEAHMEQFVGTDEGKAAVMDSPALQKLVLGSPRLKRAFNSSSKKSRNGN